MGITSGADMAGISSGPVDVAFHQLHSETLPSNRSGGANVNELKHDAS